MPCQNLVLKSLKLFRVGVLKCRPTDSHVINTAYSYSSVFSRQKLKHSFNINARLIPSNYIQTSQTHYENSEEDLTQPLVKITFITPEKQEMVIEGRVGMTVMEAAVKNKVPMEAACDGQLACTTCHVYVEEKTKQYFDDASTEEEDLLDAAPFCRPNSRLSCQLKITQEVDDAIFHLPSATANFSVDGKAKKHS